MKVLYVIEGISTAGGLERILIDKMNALSEQQDMEVVLLTVWKGQDAPAFHIDSSVQHISLEVPCPSGKLQFLFALARILKRYNAMMQVLNPDVVVHFRAIGAFLIGYGKKVCRTIFESHGVRYSNNHLWLYPRMERNVDTIVCLTNGDRQEYIRQGRCKDVRVIPNFSNIQPVSAPDYSGRRCIYIGRYCPEKDPERLIRLWHTVHSKHSDWILDIYGDWDMKDVPGVMFHGYFDNIPSAMQKGSMLLLTSRTEGFPLSVHEAMTCGLPVVSFDIKCGPRDLIVDGETGYLINPDSDEAFISAASRLMDDEALRRQMGEAARERAKLFEKDAIIQKWVALFNER